MTRQSNLGMPWMMALCVCEGGNTRSVTLARILRNRGIETLACGVNSRWSDVTIKILCDWAEVIFIQREALEEFDKRFEAALSDGERWARGARAKMNIGYDVGIDDWNVPMHPEMVNLMREKADLNLERYGTVIDLYGWVVARGV